ncbi:MAG: histidine kinase [Ilumatobacteraceae bacterium]
MAQDGPRSAALPADTAPAPIGWPLVERRGSTAAVPPHGVERRRSRQLDEPTAPLTLTTAPLWPFRLAALFGSAFRALSDDHLNRPAMIVATATYAAYTAVTCIRPIAYRDDVRVRALIAFEQVLCTVLILTTGAWGSPFALCLVPAGMLAGFAAGWLFSTELAACAVATITLQDVVTHGFRNGLQDAAVWTALLGMVAFTSGLAHRSALDGARQQRLAQDRVSMLAEANSLLFALQRVAQTLPASLDLDEVLDSTVSRVDGLMESDIVVIMLFDRSGVATAIRMRGLERLPEFPFDELPSALRDAVSSPRPVHRELVEPGEALSERSASGLYAALRARGSLVGLLAVESEKPGAFDQRQMELVHGLTEPFGIAIDNARMFRQIRTMAADEERSRIARDLHDHIGSSLATIGFEVDRAVALSHDAAKVEPVLRELRTQVSAVVSDVRETLYDLRTELAEGRDLGKLLDDYLPRVQLRSGIECTHRTTIEGRLPLMLEREVWQIIREAITNVERHSRAQHLHVVVHEGADHMSAAVRDDGVGIGGTPTRPDSYGMIGMRERAANIGATLSAKRHESGGTEIRVDIRMGEGIERWD